MCPLIRIFYLTHYLFFQSNISVYAFTLGSLERPYCVVESTVCIISLFTPAFALSLIQVL